VEEADVNALPLTDGSRANEAEPRPEDVPVRDASALGPLRSPGSSPPRDAAPSDSMLAPESSDIVDLGANELGLSGYPRALHTLSSWK
jgi:hypothetical protein